MKGEFPKYQKIQQLGQGSSGKIFKVKHKQTGDIFAAKIISLQSNQNSLSAIEQQAKIMSMCNHPNIIKCHGVELFSNEVWIILEYCEGGSLSDMMRIQKATFTEQQISAIFCQVLKGLKYLHEKKIIHRDIKASNLLLKNGEIKISDFGVAMISDKKETFDQEKYSRVGSPFWMSPEALSQSLYNDKCDIWALGITAIELAQGMPPYSHQHPFRAIYTIQTHPPENLSKPSQWSKQFCSFVKKCLTLDHKNRPQVSKLLTNPFIQQILSVPSRQGSPEASSFEEQNTLIQHQQIPKSMWQQGSFPQTSQKNEQQPAECDNTVVINQNVPSDISLFSNLKKTLQQEQSQIKLRINQQNKENIQNNHFQGMEDRENKVKQLYKVMEKQIKQVRQKYMSKIRELYQPNQQNWQSPLRKLKAKNTDILRKDHARFSSEQIHNLF